MMLVHGNGRLSASTNSKTAFTDRRATVHEIAELSLSIGSVHMIIHKHLKFWKVSARWVPKLLSSEQKQQQHDVCQDLLARYIPTRARRAFESHYYLWWNTGSHYTPESEQSSMQWKHVSSPSHKNSRCYRLQARLWLVCFQTHRASFLLTLYLLGLQSMLVMIQYTTVRLVVASVRQKWPDLLRKDVILQHDNVTPHKARKTV